MTGDERLDRAWSELGIEPTTDPDVLRSAFRRRSMETHPDRAGSREAFEKVRSAYALLLEHALDLEAGRGESDEHDSPLHGPWILGEDPDDIDVRVVDERGRPRRRGFEELFFDALRREYRDD